jgi:hypothetical protein
VWGVLLLALHVAGRRVSSQSQKAQTTYITICAQLTILILTRFRLQGKMHNCQDMGIFIFIFIFDKTKTTK